ncbi:hypothetical protein A2709_01595 [candidate division WWE3 bacterium RIFCSPHIGHO2_01_FULL_43_9]|uniref:Undecaprenyl-phosphate alpha-N-acetylglucosaminyl 1-phosphate transferase n=1 Tax=candidate division WWE3 bacterium RIFCSPHIGHO2_01_FULL_43_9 TaxID=1802618 RepID=A0A1F4V5U8_UNCKA|nr:MAG: hypothetical protein A2709_01595 [candidate division WWE3 bacterium RIFCSPHIGHO2_01_FULL_43_9]
MHITRLTEKAKATTYLVIIRLNKYLSRGLKDQDSYIRLLAIAPLVACTILIAASFNRINYYVPLWYTKLWGVDIMASKEKLFIIPVVAFLYTTLAIVLAYLAKKFYFTYLSRILLYSAGLLNLVSLASAARIVSMASAEAFFSKTIFSINISYQDWGFLGLGILGFLASYLVLPKFTLWAVKHNLVTDPSKHHHPGMILVKPSARGGGFLFAVLFLVLALLFLPKNGVTLAILSAALLCGLIGLIDDFQNANPGSKVKALENPIVRLVALLPLPVFIIILFGVVPQYVSNPFDGSIFLTDFAVTILGKVFMPLPYLFTLIWTLAIMNMLSWSNGVDGQFGGISGIAFIILGLLALRLVGTEPVQITTAKMAFIAGGICLGFIPHTWHPSKVMWGFGAVTVGLLISAISIMSRAKVATAIMIIMIPFLDGTITVARRVLQGKNPLKGDRKHLHHLLMARGWSVKRIALFYWASTLIFGTVGLITAEKSAVPVTLISGGLVSVGIIALNILSAGKEKTAIKEQLPEKQDQLQSA